MNSVSVLEVGKANINNIKECVQGLKKSVQNNHIRKPEIVVYINKGELLVGLMSSIKNLKSKGVLSDKVILTFGEKQYEAVRPYTENVLKISKMIQDNAFKKIESKGAGNTHDYTELLYNLTDFLGNNTKLNVVYSQGIGSYRSHDYVDKEDMTEDIRRDLTKKKSIKGVQIIGIPKVTLYLKLKKGDEAEVSFSFLGLKDNVYETFYWDEKESLKGIVDKKIHEAEEYDRSLEESKLDKESPASPSKKQKDSVMSMSDGELAEHIEQY